MELLNSFKKKNNVFQGFNKSNKRQIRSMPKFSDFNLTRSPRRCCGLNAGTPLAADTAGTWLSPGWEVPGDAFHSYRGHRSRRYLSWKGPLKAVWSLHWTRTPTSPAVLRAPSSLSLAVRSLQSLTKRSRCPSWSRHSPKSRGKNSVVTHGNFWK